MNINYLKECVTYYEDKGVVVWNKRPLSHFKNSGSYKSFNTKHSGREAGGLTTSGYRSLNIDGKHYQTHRVAWLIVNGAWPEEIDHINGVRVDNRIINLRNVMHKENAKNVKLSSANKSGVIGVSWSSRECKWRSTIGVNGSNKHLGYFELLSDAINTRLRASNEFGFHENHGRN